MQFIKTHKIILLLIIGLFQLKSENGYSQNESRKLNLIEDTLLSKSTREYLKLLKSHNDTIDLENLFILFNIGYSDVYMGNFKRGNELMEYVVSFITPDAEIYRELSVLNSKNGNYLFAVKYLEKAAALDKKVNGYYGWLLLYYYRDYNKSLQSLNIYDSLTPNFSDYPMGENIHFLKALNLMNLNKTEDAIKEFEINIREVADKNGEEWVEVSTFYYLGICYQKQNNHKLALLNYKKALKYFPTFPEVHYQRATCFLELNKVKQAKEDLLKAKELNLKRESKTDLYMEIFNPVYIQDIEQLLLKIQE